MEGDAETIHTVSACGFRNIEHAEYWIDKLIPKDKNGNLLKWAGGRDRKRKEESRKKFIENCLKHKNEIDFSIDVISSPEGKMSWFAWAFYFQNKDKVLQRTDTKGRNCLVFTGIGDGDISFPVLRAGYLIWYSHVVSYLSESKNIHGNFLSDNFCNDEVGQGEGKALGVAFVNFLLGLSEKKPQVSLPNNERLSKLDIISDAFCGWVNAVKTGTSEMYFSENLDIFEKGKSPIDNINFSANITIIDENGNNITALIQEELQKQIQAANKIPPNSHHT